MKSSSHILSIVIATAIITPFFACKKDIQGSQSELKGNSNRKSRVEVLSSPNNSKTNSKTSSGYVGTGTLGDSTVLGR